MRQVRWRCSALDEFECNFQFLLTFLRERVGEKVRVEGGFDCLDFQHDLISSSLVPPMRFSIEQSQLMSGWDINDEMDKVLVLRYHKTIHFYFCDI